MERVGIRGKEEDERRRKMRGIEDEVHNHENDLLFQVI